MKPTVGEKITLLVQRIGTYGEGVGSLNGFTFFVEGALPGEQVRAVVTEVRKNYGRARVVEFVLKSPHRVEPRCPVFGRCGGCQIMHLAYPQQLETKRQRVIDALERIGKMKVDVMPCIASPSPFSYRNKIQLPYQNGQLGLYAFNSHDLIEIEKCYIHCPLGERVFEAVKKVLKKRGAPGVRHVLIKTAVCTNQVLVILVTGSGVNISEIAHEIKTSMDEIKGVVQNINDEPGNVILGRRYETVAGDGFIFDTICNLTFKVSPASFFQVNPMQAENLYQKALEVCQLTGTETVLDAYCGVGGLSLLMAQKAKNVIGVEVVAEAILDAEENCRSNGIKNARFTCSLAEDFIETLSGIDIAVINPQRKGCETSFLQKLAALKPKKIVYISCDPATLARDLQLLKDYRAQTVQPFDMFPQTVHVETVVSLSLNG